MKTKLRFIGAALAALAILAAPTVQAQRPGAIPNIQGSNPGIVMSGSANYNKYPQSAKNFINKFFKGVPVAKAERFFARHSYEVELANGVDIEFDMKGNVKEIDAPDNTYLAENVVKEVLPAKSYKQLKAKGMAGLVESIDFHRGKVVKVELGIPSPDTFVFDIDGNFLVIED